MAAQGQPGAIMPDLCKESKTRNLWTLKRPVHGSAALRLEYDTSTTLTPIMKCLK